MRCGSVIVIDQFDEQDENGGHPISFKVIMIRLRGLCRYSLIDTEYQVSETKKDKMSKTDVAQIGWI